MRKKFLYPLLFCLLLSEILIPSASYAYIDPGTGSMIFQIAAASIIAFGVSCRVWFGNIKDFFYRKKR